MKNVLLLAVVGLLSLSLLEALILPSAAAVVPVVLTGGEFAFNLSVLDVASNSLKNTRPLNIVNGIGMDTVGPLVFEATTNTVMLNVGNMNGAHQFLYFSSGDFSLTKVGSIRPEPGQTGCMQRDEYNALTWYLNPQINETTGVVTAFFYRYVDGAQYETVDPEFSLNVGSWSIPVSTPFPLVCAFDPREYVFFFTLVQPIGFIIGIDVDAQKIKYNVQYPQPGQGGGPGDMVISMAYSTNNRTLFAEVASMTETVVRGIFSVDPVTGSNRSVINGSDVKVGWYQSSTYDDASSQWLLADIQNQGVYQLIDLAAAKVITTARLPNATIYAATWASTSAASTGINTNPRKPKRPTTAPRRHTPRF